MGMKLKWTCYLLCNALSASMSGPGLRTVMQEDIFQGLASHLVTLLCLQMQLLAGFELWKYADQCNSL